MEIIEGIVERLEFRFAAVAGTGVDMTDMQTATKVIARFGEDIQTLRRCVFAPKYEIAPSGSPHHPVQ